MNSPIHTFDKPRPGTHMVKSDQQSINEDYTTGSIQTAPCASHQYVAHRSLQDIEIFLNTTQCPGLKWKERIIIRNFVHQNLMGRPKIYLEQVHHTQPEAHGSTNRRLESQSDLSPIKTTKAGQILCFKQKKRRHIIAGSVGKCSRSKSARNKVFILQNNVPTTYK